jgi:hypothetical protein
LLLPALDDENAPDFGFDLPQVSGLSNKRRSVFEVWEEMAVVALKIVKEVFIQMVFEICPTDFHRDDLLVGQSRWETTTTDFVSLFHGFVGFDYQTIDGNDKSISIHRTPPANG